MLYWCVQTVGCSLFFYSNHNCNDKDVLDTSTYLRFISVRYFLFIQFL